MEIISNYRRCECGKWYRAGKTEEGMAECENCRQEVRAEYYPFGEETRPPHFLDED